MPEVEDQKENLVPDPKATDSVRFTETIEEAKAKIAEGGGPEFTAESLGVDTASFDKYAKDGEFDWASYGKEQAFKASKKATDAPAPKEEAQRDSKAPASTETKDAQESVTSAGLDWDELGVKVGNNGDIDDDDYEALEKIGVPKEVVRNYVDMVKGQSQNMIDDIISQSGGQSQFDAVFDSLSERPLELRQKIDALLVDPSTREYGVQMMFKEAGMTRSESQEAAPEPQQRSTYQPNNRTSQDRGGPTGYDSFEEQVAAQRDPRYGKDVTYRNEVMARIAASNFSMNPRAHTGGL